jgi:hypothetical protein
MLGGTAVQTLVLLWATFRTNWDKEVNLFCIYFIFYIDCKIYRHFIHIWSHTHFEPGKNKEVMIFI